MSKQNGRAGLLDADTVRFLFENLGPSLGLWRAAEVQMLRHCRFQRPVMDLGCGDGIVTSLVLPNVDYGLDPDAAALEKARRLRIYRVLLPCAVEDAPLEDASLGSVVSNSVLEHVDDLEGVLRAAARLLKPGGTLTFTTPTETFSSILTIPARRYADWRNRRYGHVNLWPIQNWAQILDQAGFEIEKVRHYMNARLVKCWDSMDLAEQIWIGRRRLVGIVWKRLPEVLMERISRAAARIDFSSAGEAGGRLIVARKR